MSGHRLVLGASLALGLGLLAGSPAAAQSTALRADDIAYCHQLKGIYDRRMPTTGYGSTMGATPSAETSVALTLCVPGRSAEGVALLEKVLRSNGYRLPDRAVAQQP
ncbi:MAG TPA: hypothetical protein VJ890_22890 [Vineibacter sp.]|nr:hypothetical protein [Vineibacter sp.]